MIDVGTIKKDFPIFENYKNKNGQHLVYLDSAASSQTPRSVVEAMNDYYFNYRANVHRGPHALSVEATNAYEQARATVAKFIHAETKEVVFTPGATAGINMLVLMLEKVINLTPEDDILVSLSEHHSNFIPFQELARRTKAKMRLIPLKSADLDYDTAQSLITSKTKIVAIPLASNVLGTVYDVQRIIRQAKESGAVTIVDATTAIGHMDVDVQILDCDFLFFSGHKMLGPTGIGGLYGKKDMFAKLQPIFSGGGAIKSVSQEEAIYRDSPMCFEAGTPNIAGAIGLAAAVRYIESLGIESISAHIQDLVQYCTESLNRIPEIAIVSEKTEQKNIGIVSFVVRGVTSMQVTQALGRQHISSRGGYHCAMPLVKAIDMAGVCRASFYVYNERSDVDRLVGVLKNMLRPDKKLGKNKKQSWRNLFARKS